MSAKCFVPNCKNTVGVPFPEDSEFKKKWLESLSIKDIVPNSTSYVCFGHFQEADLTENEGSISVKEGAIPSKITLSTTNNDTNVESHMEELHRDSVGDDQETEVQTKATDSDNEVNKKMPSEDVPEETEGSVTNEDSKESVNDEESESHDKVIIIDTEDTSESSVMENETEEAILTDKEKRVCRLCAEERLHTQNIFEGKVENVPVSVAIMECIYPIEISRNDKLSKDICPNCLECINSYFKFRSICLDNDKKQRDLHGEDNLEKPVQKRKTCAESTSSSKKPRVEEIITDSEYDFDDDDDDDDLESLNNFLIRKNANPVQNKKQSALKETISKQKDNEIQKKFDKVEEELRRVLEGQLTEEQAKAENIIIHVENDDKQPQKVAKLSKLKLPIVIKPVDTKRVKRIDKGVVPKTSVSPKGSVTIKTVSSDEITLPRGINVKLKESYTSEIGVYEGIPLTYLFDLEFCQIDGYLFEYRLCKGSERFLRCVLPTCQSLAVQSRVGTGEFSWEMTVQKPHNHKSPGKADTKKQMFYYVMKRKMQSDKTLNFRSVYEEVCKHDSEIKELVPLRNVINEICRHQLTYKIPSISSFEHFYSHIEEDAFQKLHFTHNGAQFYQERFTGEDESIAVIFANADIIEQVSQSYLMYIDASFKIDTNEEFKYQLVTVLVWVDDSYYPILYALINKKSQEIYKKIFEYLHDYLAPKLRPHEIVTDYEANLYYALGETYLDSAIGGSVFYYTQNLYKKICVLNLSRDLETNSYFRNIYHMLLMLPLLPVNTILDGLNNMEIQARDLGLANLTRPIFDHVRTEWIMKVTPDLFCVHRLESRINENVIAPFKKLRDFIMLSKGKMQRQHTTIVTVVEKLIELEHFLQVTYSAPNKKSFARDLSSSQKKNVLKAWQYIESHPKININNFFSKVLGYIKCMENQLWIWGFYRYDGDISEELINANNFSILPNEVEMLGNSEEVEQIDSENVNEEGGREGENGQVVMEAVIDENGGFVLQNGDGGEQGTQFENAFFKYVYRE